jgi:hypothetical protein
MAHDEGKNGIGKAEFTRRHLISARQGKQKEEVGQGIYRSKQRKRRLSDFGFSFSLSYRLLNQKAEFSIQKRGSAL